MPWWWARYDRTITAVRSPGSLGRSAAAAEPVLRGVVERLVEPVAREHPLARELAEVLRGGLRVDHRRERGRVRRDHDVVREAALESEVGDAERAVLVVAGPVDEVEARLADAPGHAERPAVLDLPTHRVRGSSGRGASPCASFSSTSGIRYSNIDPLHETQRRAGRRPTRTRRPRRNQCACGTSSFAIARKLASRASDASRS